MRVVRITDEGELIFNGTALSRGDDSDLNLSAELYRYRRLHSGPAPVIDTVTLDVSARTPMKSAGIHRYDRVVETPRYWSDL